MSEQYFFYYKHSAGECKEGPYTMDQALARKLDFGHAPSCEPKIELEKKDG